MSTENEHERERTPPRFLLDESQLEAIYRDAAMKAHEHTRAQCAIAAMSTLCQQKELQPKQVALMGAVCDFLEHYFDGS